LSQIQDIQGFLGHYLLQRLSRITLIFFKDLTGVEKKIQGLLRSSGQPVNLSILYSLVDPVYDNRQYNL